MATLEFDQRPWGNYQVLEDAEGHKVKRILVSPGKRLSLQRHARRAEHWFVVEGRGVVTVDDQLVPVGPGTAVDIPVARPTGSRTTATPTWCSSRSSTGTTSARTTSSGSRTTSAGPERPEIAGAARSARSARADGADGADGAIRNVGRRDGPPGGGYARRRVTGPLRSGPGLRSRRHGWSHAAVRAPDERAGRAPVDHRVGPAPAVDRDQRGPARRPARPGPVDRTDRAGQPDRAPAPPAGGHHAVQPVAPRVRGRRPVRPGLPRAVAAGSRGRDPPRRPGLRRTVRRDGVRPRPSAVGDGRPRGPGGRRVRPGHEGPPLPGRRGRDDADLVGVLRHRVGSPG